MSYAAQLDVLAAALKDLDDADTYCIACGRASDEDEREHRRCPYCRSFHTVKVEQARADLALARRWQ